MTESDKRCLIAALRAVENLSLQNLALQVILERFSVPDWKALSDQLSLSQDFWPEVRANFRKVLDTLEQEPPDRLEAKSIQDLLLKLPPQGKPN
jgi:hypothetical protein